MSGNDELRRAMTAQTAVNPVVSIDRRRVVAAGGAAGAMLAGSPGVALPLRGKVALVADPADPVASAPAAQWAAGQLQAALAAAGWTVSRRAGQRRRGR